MTLPCAFDVAAPALIDDLRDCDRLVLEPLLREGWLELACPQTRELLASTRVLVGWGACIAAAAAAACASSNSGSSRFIAAAAALALPAFAFLRSRRGLDAIYRSVREDNDQMLARGAVRFLVARGADGAPVGLVGVRASLDPAHPGAAELIRMVVAPTWRRSGVGRALLDAAVAHARNQGHRQVILACVGCNRGARRLYERAGFVPGAVSPWPQAGHLLGATATWVRYTAELA
eukprot:tig00001366_g8394.t1